MKLTRKNTWFDGGNWPADVAFDDLDWKQAWLDQGPSPAGNAGPYLKVPRPEDGTVHRIYSKKVLSAFELLEAIKA